MNYKEFIEKTIFRFDDEAFESLKKSLVGEYIRYSFIPETHLTKELLAEKMCDYFEKLEFKKSMSFDKAIQEYAENLQSIIESRIAEKPKSKKKEQTEVKTSRARKYYNKAQNILDSRDLTVRNLIDYSRIMFCLYMSIIENENNLIKDLNFSADSLSEGRIIAAMKNEKKLKKIGSKPLFDTTELYCADTCTFIITIIMLQTIAYERR